MSVKTITLSEDVSAWVEQEAATRQMSADEFVSQLAREAWNRAHSGRADDKAELEQLLIEAVNSGAGERVTKEWWGNFRTELNEDLEKQKLNAKPNGTSPL